MNRKNKKEVCNKIESNKISTLIQRDEILSDDLEIKVECTFIGEPISLFVIIHHQNKRITGHCSPSLWGDEQAILEMAKEAVKFHDLIKPFTE
jgi:hypothetical protein